MAEIHEIMNGLNSPDLSARWRAAIDLQEKMRNNPGQMKGLVLARAAVARLEVDYNSPKRGDGIDRYAMIMENCLYTLGHAISAGIDISEIHDRVIEIVRTLKNDGHRWVREAVDYVEQKHEEKKRDVKVTTWDTERMTAIRNRDTPTKPARAIVK